MTPHGGNIRDPRNYGRREWDSVRVWLPVAVSLCVSIFSLGVVYGKLDAHLTTIDDRLFRLEQRTSGTR